jgi:acyl dehydratase
MMRVYSENYPSQVANLGSPGGDELRWDKPVFPGDVLSVRATVLETRRSESRFDRGIVRTFIEVLNQKREVFYEHEDGEFRQMPKRQALRVVPWPNTRCYLG